MFEVAFSDKNQDNWKHWITENKIPKQMSSKNKVEYTQKIQNQKKQDTKILTKE